jgi:hypothetical protein
MRVYRTGNRARTLAVEPSFFLLFGRELADPVVIVAKEVKGEVTHVLLCEIGGLTLISCTNGRGSHRKGGPCREPKGFTVIFRRRSKENLAERT